MVSRPDKDTSLVVRPPIGGLQTKYRSPIVVPSQTPDALNVLYDKRSVRRREGCQPINRYLPGKNSIRNIGIKAVGRSQASTGSITFKSVPGHGIIGHRSYFNDYRKPTNDIAFTLSFLVMPEPDEDNYREDANWFTFNEDGTTSYLYRPYVSKGPIGDNNSGGGGTSEWATGEGGWSVGIKRHAASGKPQWYALLNLNAGLVPTELVSDPTLATAPRPGHIYRLTLFGTTVTPGATYNYGLSISELTRDGTASTELLQTGNVATRLLVNTGPILLFDMPASFLEPPNARQGLNLGNGGYLRSVLRGEGRIEDLSLWNVDKTSNLGDLSFARSFEVTDPTGQTGLIGYWRPQTTSERSSGVTTDIEDGNWIPESTGKDAPILLCPCVPTWNRTSIGTASLYFDGRTSYVFMPTGINTTLTTPTAGQVGDSNNNMVASTGANSFERLVVTGSGSTKVHSIQMTFIPDSIEPRNDNGVEVESQCLMYWRGVVKLGISTRGKLYCSPVVAAGAFAAAITLGTTALVPGQRYTLTYRRTADATATVHLNGELDVNIAGLAAPGAVTDGLPGMILGMEDTIDGVTADSTGRGSPRSTDYTKAFLGRIEDVRIAGGLLDTTLWNRKLTLDQEYVNTTLAWAASSGSANLTANGAPPTGVGGYWFHTPYYTAYSKPPFFSQNTLKALLINANVGTTQLSVAANPPLAPTGVDSITRQFMRISQYLAWWQFSDSSILTTNRESRYRSGREYVDTPRYIFQHELAVADEFGFAWPMTLRSIQPDRLASQWGTAQGTYVSPWLQTTPLELKPKLGRGLVPSAPGTNPITYLGQLKKADGNRYLLASAASSLYWVQPPWWRGVSPYTQENDSTQTSFFGAGRLGQHIKIRDNSDWTMSSASTDLTFEFWINVPELGERREIAMSWGGGTSEAYNWRIMLSENGGLYVEGWANAAYWRIGTQVSVAGAPSQYGPIQPGRWQFVAIVLDADTTANDQVWVDGVAQPMDAAVGNHNTNWAEPGSVAKWIAGHPSWFLTPHIGVGVEDSSWLPLFGFLRDFRVSNSQRYVTTSAVAFAVPTSPLTADANTFDLLLLNEGADLVATSTRGVATTTDVHKGWLRCEEMLPILDGSILGNNSSERYPYSASQYGDVLFLTNGLGVPLAVRHDGSLRNQRGIPPDGRGPKRPFGFYVGRMGITQPGNDPPSLTGEPAGGTATPVFAENASIQLAVTFIDINGNESDPVSYTLTTPNDPAHATGGWDRLKLTGIPRSLEPHVVSRWIYVGSTIGATPKLFNAVAFTDDNTTDDVEISQSPGNGKDVEFTNAPPPRARYGAVFRGRSYLLTDDAQLVFSEALKPESVSLSSTAINIIKLEAGAGGVGTFVREHLGQLYAGTRRAVFNVQPGVDVANFAILPVNTSRGYISNGSLISFDNDMIGAMQKGILSFEGSGFEYLSENLEGMWTTIDPSITPIDLSPSGALSMHGAYLDRRNQYWLTIRRTNERFGREMLVYDRVVTDDMSGQHPWSLIKTLKHSFLTVIEDPFDGNSKIYFGTPEGQVHEMLAGIPTQGSIAFNDCDGSRQMQDPGATSGGYTMQGFVFTPNTTTTITPLLGGASLDVLGNGLRGLWCTIAFSNPSHTTALFGQTYELRIKSNTSTTITFETALPEAALIGDLFVIGAYWAYQATPWLSFGTIANVKQVMSLDLDYAPNPLTSLDLRWLVTDSGRNLDDAFDYTAPATTQQRSLSQTDGYHSESIRVGPRGLYWRMFMGTRGINLPFEVFGWDVGLTLEGNRKGMQ